MSMVVVVVVTRHRRELLGKSLAVVAEQTRMPDHLVVVDNGPDDPAEEVVADCPIPSTYLPSLRNLGGAGGFALGILHALALGADWVWLADDDGCPADVRVLQTLLEEARRRDLAVSSPVVVNIDDPERLAFPLRRGLTWKRRRSELGTDFLPGIASFFNGALFSADALDVVGVPDYRLFVRGDEVEVHRRVVRSGLRFGTTLRASYAHPDGSAEFKPMLRGHFHAQDPADEVKRYYTYRNRGYLLSQPGMRWIGMLEVFRFGLY
ncbi:MAG: galactofuranosyltransferase GlfT1, partial [Pseudonocardiaceae bacterium]